MTALCDLHIHTYFSDGTQSPLEIVEEAHALGISVISVTDHNTLAAYDELPALCRARGMRLLCGAELDVLMGEKPLHLLAYGMSPRGVAMSALCARSRAAMTRLNDAVIFNMARDYGLDLVDYAAFAAPPELGGYKNSNYLLARGVIASIPEYFPIARKYGVSVLEVGLPQLREACELIRGAGACPVLAHPLHMLGEALEDGLRQALDAGVMGFECHYTSHDEAGTRTLLDFCERHALLVTGGSDGHGQFNRVIHGIEYTIGAKRIELGQLRLGELSFLV